MEVALLTPDETTPAFSISCNRAGVEHRDRHDRRDDVEDRRHA
jgi:hypothetical protein